MVTMMTPRLPIPVMLFKRKWFIYTYATMLNRIQTSLFLVRTVMMMVVVMISIMPSHQYIGERLPRSEPSHSWIGFEINVFSKVWVVVVPVGVFHDVESQTCVNMHMCQ